MSDVFPNHIAVGVPLDRHCVGLRSVQSPSIMRQTTYTGIGTEKATAEAIKKSGLPRSDVWITTKLQ